MPLICLEKAGDNEYFTLPSAIVDRHLSTCGEVEIKLILWLIRNDGNSMDAAKLCTLLKTDQIGLDEAIRYWVQSGVLSRRGGRLTLASASTSSTPPRYSGETVRLRAQQDDGLRQLFESYEQITGKPIGSEDMAELFAIYDYLALPPDVILMIAAYAKSVDKAGMAYIKRVAADWSERGIDNMAAANQMITKLEDSRKHESKIKIMFGIGDRALTKREKEYISTWCSEREQSLELIELAYNEAVDRKGKLSFAYIDGILKSWHEQGIKTPDEVGQEKEKYKKKEQKKDDASKGDQRFDMERHLQMSWDIITK